MKADLLELPSNLPIADDLRSAWRESRTLRAVLDTGETFIVMPDRNFEALHTLFNDPGFAAALERSLEELREGNFTILEDGQEPDSDG